MTPLRAKVEIEVPFHDVDMMKIVWHGHYAKYFEIARCSLLESFDFSYRQMAASNYSWPVVDLRIRFVKPVVYGQKIFVEAILMEYENRLKINYIVSDSKTGVRLAKGHTVQVAVSMETQEMCLESPDILLEKLSGLIQKSHKPTNIEPHN